MRCDEEALAIADASNTDTSYLGPVFFGKDGFVQRFDAKCAPIASFWQSALRSRGMTIAKIEGHLRESIGLDAASIGPSSIDRAVRSRMIACNEVAPDTGNYWDRIQASSAEAQELIEAVVVSETWFFRDRGAFASLTRFVEANGRSSARSCVC